MALSFGTSGIRGLVTEFTEAECYYYSAAFISFLKNRDVICDRILMAGDLRESTPAIIDKIASSLASFGVKVLDGGCVPTPALAYGCAELKLPGIMVTGSHIPADRNGFKFYLSEGEILKADEAAIMEEYQLLKSTVPVLKAPMIEKVNLTETYLNRYLNYFGKTALTGLKLGFYEHSGVGRDLVVDILRALGAEVFPFARSNEFIPVDTEAVQSTQILAQKLHENKWDALISTDGDADRPLVMSDSGKVIPGEILGLITSKILAIEQIVFPVSCSTSIENSGFILRCERTKIGSPFVLGKIEELKKEFPKRTIAGFEANGGYLLATSLSGLSELNTRDSVLPIISVLKFAKEQYSSKISELMKSLPSRINESGLIKNYERSRSEQVLLRVKKQIESNESIGCSWLGLVSDLNELDGLRMTFQDGSIVHLRPSGNAPEFRIYVESESEAKVKELLAYFENWLNAQTV